MRVCQMNRYIGGYCIEYLLEKWFVMQLAAAATAVVVIYLSDVKDYWLRLWPISMHDWAKYNRYILYLYQYNP